MNTIIAKYVKAFHDEKGSATERVKKILMRYAHTWEWQNADGLVADLIDDSNITADDIVDVLADAYAMEDGNEEFRYAVRALQICLRKAQLAEITEQENEADAFEDNGFENDNSFYLPRDMEMLHHHKYQE